MVCSLKAGVGQWPPPRSKVAVDLKITAGVCVLRAHLAVEMITRWPPAPELELNLEEHGRR